ncbi:MAG: AMP-binding protein, partial [Halieaceae bacterium]
MALFTQPYHDALAQLTMAGAPFEITTVDSSTGPVLAFVNHASDLRSFMAGGRDHGDKLLLQYQGRDWSFKDFFTAVDSLSQWLLEEYA